MKSKQYNDFFRKLKQKLNCTIEIIKKLPGKSGASTYLIKVKGEETICKIYPNENKYNKEKKGYSRSQLKIINHDTIKIGREQTPLWYILMPYEGEDIGDFLNESDVKTVHNFFGKLFDNLYRHLDVTPEKSKSAFSDTFTENFWENLESLDKSDTMRFKTWWKEKSNCIEYQLAVRNIHGDLHMGNIRITKNGEPIAIDWECAEQGLALKDFARLERDIRLTMLYQHKNLPDQKTFSETQTQLNARLAGDTIDKDSCIEKIYQVITFIREKAKTSHEDISFWEFEYYYTLMLEFMFYAASEIQEFPQAKKVAFQLGMVLMDKVEIILTQQYLWKVVYSLMRMDQLPNGGWGKSLPGWWRETHGNTPGNLFYSYNLRKKGGMNVTCNTFIQYFYFISRVIGFDLDGNIDKGQIDFFYETEKNNNLSRKLVYAYIRPRIGKDGGMDSFSRSLGDDQTKTNVHHSVLALICYIIAFFFFRRMPITTDVRKLRSYFQETASYLVNKIHKWRDDKNKYFAIFASISYLLYLLEKVNLIKGLINENNLCKDSSKNCISLHDFKEKLKDTQQQINDELSFDGIDTDFLFQSNYFFNQSGTRFILPINNKICEPRIKEFQEQFIALIKDTINQCDQGNTYCLIPVESNFDRKICEDLGSLAQLNAILAKPVIKKMIIDQEPSYREKIKSLKKELINLSTEFKNENQEYFRRTNSTTYSYILNSLDLTVTKESFEKIEKLIREQSTISEYNVWNMLFRIFKDSYHSFKNEAADNILTADSKNRLRIIYSHLIGKELYVLKKITNLKNLFLSKLEPGIFNQHPYKDKDTIYKQTREFFNSDLAKMNAEANFEQKKSKKFQGIHLDEYLHHLKNLELDNYRLHVLDIGCGKGWHAINTFLKNGCRMDLLDYSETILKLAGSEIEKGSYEFNTLETFDLSEINTFSRKKTFKNNKYDIIFCDAVLLHLTRDDLPNVLKELKALLADDGLLFANFKINDHTIVSWDGRFFEYYENHHEITKILNEAGFRIQEMTMTQKDKNMYREFYRTHWVHYYCWKESVPEET